VTQQIFEERKKTINSILQKSGATPIQQPRQGPSGIRNRTKTPMRASQTLEAVPQLNSDLNDQTEADNTRA